MVFTSNPHTSLHRRVDMQLFYITTPDISTDLQLTSVMGVDPRFKASSF